MFNENLVGRPAGSAGSGASTKIQFESLYWAGAECGADVDGLVFERGLVLVMVVMGIVWFLRVRPAAVCVDCSGCFWGLVVVLVIRQIQPETACFC